MNDRSQQRCRLLAQCAALLAWTCTISCTNGEDKNVQRASALEPASKKELSVRVDSTANIIAIEIAGVENIIPATIEPSTRIRTDSSGGSAPSYAIVAAELTRTGVLVADATSKSITEYSSEGQLVRRVGRRGSGPGEFQTLSHLFTYHGDSVVAVDFQGRRLTLFDGDGRPVRVSTLNTPAEVPGGWIDVVASGLDGKLLYAVRPINRGAKVAREVRYDASMYNGTFDEVDLHALNKVPDALNHEGVFTDIGEVPYAGVAYFARTKDAILISDPVAPRVQIFDARGRATATLRISTKRSAILAEHEDLERERLLDELKATHAGVPERFMSGFRKRIKEVAFPDSFPTISGLLADGDQLLIELFTPPTKTLLSRTYVVANVKSATATMFKLQPGARASSLRDGRVAAIRTDGNGDQTVEVYTIRQ